VRDEPLLLRKRFSLFTGPVFYEIRKFLINVGLPGPEKAGIGVVRISPRPLPKGQEFPVQFPLILYTVFVKNALEEASPSWRNNVACFIDMVEFPDCDSPTRQAALLWYLPELPSV